MSQEEVKKEVSIEDMQKILAEKEAVIQDLQTQFGAVKSKADQLLDETKKAKAKAREEAEAKERAEKERAQKNGDFEQLLKSSEKERQTLAEQLQQLNNKISAEKTRSESMRLASELADGANAEILSEFISKRIKYTDEGLKVLNEHGELTVSSLEHLKSEFEGSEKFKSLLRGNMSSGGGAVGAGNSVAKKEITMAEFQTMAPTSQREFIAKGGSIQ